MILVLVGPSAVGKTALAAELVRRGHVRLVSCTTRKPRPGEQDGRDYHFMQQEIFDVGIARGYLAEHSGSFGSSYGMPRSEIEGLPEGRVGVAVLDLRGALALKAEYPDKVVTFAILPPSWDVLETRLQERGSDWVDTALRLSAGRTEAEAARRACDEQIMNGNVVQAASEILAVAMLHTYRVSRPANA